MIPPQKSRRQRPDTDRAAQREATKVALMAAARTLFTSRGYEGVSVSDIGAEAGVSASLINAYFGSKAGLLYALVTDHNQGQPDAARAAAAPARTAMGKLERVIGAWTTMDLREPALLSAMMGLYWTWSQETEAVNATERKPNEDLLAEIVRAGVAAGELRKTPVERAVRMIWSLYAQGLRPAIYENWTAEQCAAEIAAQVKTALAP